jgi:hypothetical protein
MIEAKGYITEAKDQGKHFFQGILINTNIFAGQF